MLAVTLESRAVERLLVVGVSDADDQPRALLKRASVQVHGSVLGNEPVDVRARRDDAGSERQLGRDLADALVRGRGHGEDRLAAFGTRGSVNEVDLSADARVELRTERVGADLARQVDLKGRVDRRHFRVLGDYERVVRIADIHHGDAGVVVDEVVYFLQPIRNVETIFPLSIALFRPLITPLSTSGSTPSANISVWMPRFLWPPS